MATTKTIRLRSDQAAWLEAMATKTRLSQNRLIEVMIDKAMADWAPGDTRLAEVVVQGER